jgi:hypothetical protein
MQAGRFYELPSRLCSGAVIKTQLELKDAFFVANHDSIGIKRDEHIDSSYYVSFGKPVERLLIFSGSSSGKARFAFIDSKTLHHQVTPIISRTLKQTKSNDIDFISPLEWRAGLPPPLERPSFTPTQHIIIHHSASTNIIENSFDEVRNIYLHHTQINGWSDIGYNFLISPDGLIFQGRDDQGQYNPDNILGAHMCGVNSGTMGICLMGDFENQLPTDEALHALRSLLVWKVNKERMQVFGSRLHAIGPPSEELPMDFLPTICGHLDGCDRGYTECPGSALYEYLFEIKEQVNSMINKPELFVYNNPANKIIKANFGWIRCNIYDLHGRIITSSEEQEEGYISLSTLSMGIYVAEFITKNYGRLAKKITIR